MLIIWPLTRRPECATGLPADLDTFCILPLRAAPGLIRSNAGLQKSLLKPFAVAIFVQLNMESAKKSGVKPPCALAPAFVVAT